MLKLVSLLPGIHKLKYVGSILKQQNWCLARHLIFSYLEFFACCDDLSFYFQGIWALSGPAVVVLLASPADF